MSQALTRSQLARTIARLIHDGETKTLAKEVAAYLLAERRTKELASLMRDVARVRQDEYGIMEATATSTHPLASEIKRDIKAYLRADKLVLNEELDPTLVGGLRLETVDQQLDGSVHNRLRKLKQLVSEV